LIVPIVPVKQQGGRPNLTFERKNGIGGTANPTKEATMATPDEPDDPTPHIPDGASDEVKKYLTDLNPAVWIVLNRVRKYLERHHADTTQKAQVV
jgi:hypothetical protein